MKISLKTLALLGVVLLMCSCSKDSLVEENDKVSQEINIDGKSVFHKSYDGNLSIEEVKVLWKKDLMEFKGEQSVLKSSVNDFEFEVVTKTANIKNANTDDKVTCEVRFVADNKRLALNCELNNPNNDRERGQWDIYVLKAAKYGNYGFIQQLSLSQITLSLQGNDGWKVDDFRVAVYGELQNNQATGNSVIATRPGVWLDNNSKDSSVKNYFSSDIYTNSGVVTW